KDSINFSKNKLYAGYATVPFMVNINTSPGRKKGLSLSAGISAGYLVGNHTKEISSERGKEKTKGDLGLEKFRLAYIGELGIGPVRLFGSYSLTKLHENGLEQYPYSLGIRFSNW
ncbi:MAG: outer membrane beta-barrel protein, partial [Segetibacter sp.]